MRPWVDMSIKRHLTVGLLTKGTNVECPIYERGRVHVMPVWVDHFYFEPWAGGDAVCPLVLGNDDDQAGDEENVEMEESPEGEESDAQLTRGE